MQLRQYENIKIYKNGNIQIYMQENKNVKNVKDYVKKVDIYIKNYKVTSNRNVKPNKKRTYENNKYTDICIKIYIYKHQNKQIYRNSCTKIYI